MLVVISEAICVLLIEDSHLSLILNTTQLPISLSNEKQRINQWLAGYIDGDGYFSYSKKGYVSLEITTSIRDKRALYFIKQIYGGSVKIVSGNKYLRYR